MLRSTQPSEGDSMALTQEGTQVAGDTVKEWVVIIR